VAVRWSADPAASERRRFGCIDGLRAPTATNREFQEAGDRINERVERTCSEPSSELYAAGFQLGV
jgi:hypothetical protein